MHEDLLRESRRLPQYGVLHLRGPEAKPFLQGQLSADVLALTPNSVVLASCNSAQGRVQAVLWALAHGDDVLLLTAAESLAATTARLTKYVLRANVKFEPTKLSVYGHSVGSTAATAWTAPLRQEQHGDIHAIQWPGNRTLVIAPANDATTDGSFAHDWQLADLRAGIPVIHTQTHESFVAQMLNLDLLGGISFEKGCYTGQEIIARTHFRGSVKRRMFRYQFKGQAPAPGTRIVAGEEAAGEVVTSVATGSGSELLAVVQLSNVSRELSLEGQSVALQSMALPYSLPTAV